MNNKNPRLFQFVSGIGAILLFFFVFAPVEGQGRVPAPLVPVLPGHGPDIPQLDGQPIPATADSQPLIISAKETIGAVEQVAPLAPSDVPDAPTLVSPADGGNVPGTSINFQWNLVSGATDYQLQIATDSGFSNLVFDQELNGVFNSVNISPLADNGLTYWWRVRAENGMGWGDWSAEWSVTNGPSAAPATPTLISPADMADIPGTSVTLQWNAPRAADIQLQVSIESAFNAPFLDQQLGGPFIGLNLSSLPDDGTIFYWRVRGWNSLGWSNWSDSREFTNGPSAVPPITILTAPGDGTNVPGLNVLFQWQQTARATDYHFQLSYDNSFTNLIFDIELGNVIGFLISGFPDVGETYWWRVQAGNSLGDGPWSSASSFINGPSSPTQISGTVTDGVNPVADAVVEVEYKATTTNALGQYTLTNLHAGEQIILASKSGYNFDFTELDISNGANLTGVDFVLTSDGTMPQIQPSGTTVNFALPETSSFTQAKPLPAAPETPKLPAGHSASSDEGIVPNQYIIRLKPGRSAADVQAMSAFVQQEFDGKVVKNRATPQLINSFEHDPYIVVELPEGQEPSLDNFASLPVTGIEPRHYYYTLTPPTNDPLYSYLWGWPRIQMPLAWSLGAGTATTKVAIIDSGVDYTHPDLAPNFGTNKGYDFVDNDSDPAPDVTFENHGTHVAGTLGAAINNSTGIAGMGAFELLSVRSLNEAGSGLSDDIADGINWATSEGAQVINMSIGGPFDSLIASAVANAHANNVVLVAAAGNDNVSALDYPAAYAEVIAVGSVNSADQRSSFSNYGPGLDVVAPGSLIMSTLNGNDYGYFSGTSMASPHVAGVAALILNHAPALTHDQVRNILTGTADDLGPNGWDNDFGHGRLNAYQALLAALQAGDNSRILNLQNTGSALLNVTDITNSESWLTVSPTSFAIDPGGAQDVYLFADVGLLSAGFYTDTLNISSNDAGSPLNVDITLQIVSGLEHQEVALDSGWNMVSSYLNPTLTDMDDIFPLPERHDLLLCKNNMGQVYWPSLDIDSIGTWDAQQGYQCYASQSFNAPIDGLPFNPADSISLNMGWNIAAYWRDTAVPIDQAFNSLGSDLLLAKNNEGLIYWPEFSINQIGDLQPGQGYQVYMNVPGTLTYP